MPTTYAIPNGRTVMDVTLYTGDGTNGRTITNNDLGTNGFIPDLVWIKGRSNTGSHSWQDSNRGFGSATKLSSNSNNAENNNAADATDPIYGFLTGITANGFTANNSSTGGQVNGNGVTYVAWQWNAGSNTSTSNTSGSITSTVSANTNAGFSIVKYTGTGANNTSYGHGLSATPNFIIIKERTGTNGWLAYHSSLANPTATYMVFNGTANAATASGWCSPNATTITYTTSYSGTNTNGSNYVAYCWTAIPGFSAFGSYTGNGSTDGTFVYTGFRPRFILYKPTNIGTATDWVVWDTVRNTYNVLGNYLLSNSFAAEGTATVIDILSNGFKLRTTSTGNNGSGDNIIYAAFAENPFKYANAR